MRGLNVFLWHLVVIMMFAAACMDGFAWFAAGIVLMYWCSVFSMAAGKKDE